MLQVLLVDDEPYVVDDLSIALPWEDLQFEFVHKAYSGMQALEILEKHPIDIVITDISMPGMTGLELIEHIRSRWKHIKCVLLTGYAEFEYAKKAIQHHASEYLLKPIGNEPFIEMLIRLREEIRLEWEEKSSYQRTVQTLNEHLPLLRDKLLNQLLQGRQFSNVQLSEQTQKYELNFAAGKPAALLAVRLEDYFQQQDGDSLLLFEYAIVNIAGELFQEHFQIWSCKEIHDYLIFLLQPKSFESSSSIWQEHLQRTAYLLQRNVNAYLKGAISVVTTPWGVFPDETRDRYQTAVSAIRRQIGRETGLFLAADAQSEAPDIQSLRSLHEPPTLLHLFEINQWDAIEEKLDAIMDELKEAKKQSLEHTEEVRHYLEATFYYIAHKNNKLLGEIIGPDQSRRLFHSADALREWALDIVRRLREYVDIEQKDSRSVLIREVHDFADRNIGYVSLQSIADHVKLHPVYLSKIYKSETGKSISNYLLQLKMEKATHLLLHTPLKIYEISSMLGYSSAHYFIKLFKDYRQMTPQEYRDRSAGVRE